MPWLVYRYHFNGFQIKKVPTIAKDKSQVHTHEVFEHIEDAKAFQKECIQATIRARLERHAKEHAEDLMDLVLNCDHISEEVRDKYTAQREEIKESVKVAPIDLGIVRRRRR